MNQFVQDMEDAGFDVEAYHGRWYWQGPAVRFDGTRELQEIIRATEVEVQWDSPLVYPVESDKTWYDENQGRYTDNEDEDE